MALHASTQAIHLETTPLARFGQEVTTYSGLPNAKVSVEDGSASDDFTIYHTRLSSYENYRSMWSCSQQTGTTSVQAAIHLDCGLTDGKAARVVAVTVL